MLESQFQDDMLAVLKRIAVAQEKLLEIAEEARKGRHALSTAMLERFKQPLDIPPLKEA